MGHARRRPSHIHEPRGSALVCRVGTPRRRGPTCAATPPLYLQQRRCCSPHGVLRAGSAAEVWDVDGATSLPGITKRRFTAEKWAKPEVAPPVCTLRASGPPCPKNSVNSVHFSQATLSPCLRASVRSYLPNLPRRYRMRSQTLQYTPSYFLVYCTAHVQKNFPSLGSPENQRTSCSHDRRRGVVDWG